jgi:hypothetical protein
MDHETSCEHDFVLCDPTPFAGTDGARSCKHCERVEVLVNGLWMVFERFQKRRSDQPPPPG